MNPFKYAQMIKYLTRVKKQKPDLPNVFPASKAPIPAKKQTVEDMEAVNRFVRANPRQDMAGGGMLVQPGFGGTRQGYKEDKYITPARRTGAEGFQGQKYISVKDSTYSDGRRRVKTPEYEEYLKKEIAKAKKRPDYGSKGFIRREPGLLRIAEAMQQADINDDPEFMMLNKKATKTQEKYYDRKMKVFKKGMLEGSDIVYINNLEKNFDDVIFIADQLGESPDWVLDKLEERTNFRDFAKGEKDILKKDPKYTKPRNDYLKVENWVQKNAKKYAKPETFEKALIKRFGKDNQFVKDMNSKKPFVQTYFSDDFKKTMLNITAEKSRSKPSHLKQFIKSSLYNFNPKIKNAVTAEIKNIFKSENLPKLRTEARKLLNNNKLLSTFGLNEAITGPYARVIQAEIGQQLFADITNFRQHRVGTQEMLKAFEQIVADEFKPMFNETAKAIGFSKQNQWPKAKEILGLADNIAWDHKVPSSLIDKGYADIIEYTKVNPTTANFNERIKNAQFDRPINQLITKFEKATTLDAKAKIKNEMDIVKNNFSQKYGGYLDEISINLDPQGNLKFSSSAKPLTMKDDRIAMLGKSMVQEGVLKEGSPLYKKLMKFCPKSSGGSPGVCTIDEAMTGLISESKQLQSGNMNEAQAKKTAQKIRAVTRVGTGATLTSLLGPYGLAGEVVIDGAFMANNMLDGGDTYKEALSKSLIKYAMPTDARKQLEKETDRDRMILGSDTQGLAADFVSAKQKYEDLINKYENLEKIKKDKTFDIDTLDPTYSPKDEIKAQKEFELAQIRAEPTYGKSIFDIYKFGSPEQQAFAAKEEVFDAQKMQNRMDYDRQILGPLKDLFDTGFYSPAQLKQLELKADRDTEEIGQIPDPIKIQGIANYGGVANLAGGGIAGLSGGIDKGPPPESGPNSQGLQGLMKRVRNR